MMFYYFLTLLVLAGGISGTRYSGKQYCDACNKLVDFGRLFNEHLERNPQFKDDIVQACLKADHNVNRHFCTVMVSDLVGHFQRVDSVSFCYNVRACDSFAGFAAVLPSSDNSPLGDSVSCDFCLNAVAHLKDVLTSNETEAEVKKVLLESCKRLGRLQSECNELFTTNLAILFDFIREKIQPKRICDSLKFCEKQATKLPAIPALEDVVNVIPDYPHVKPVAVVPSKDSVTFGPTCVICKKLMIEIDHYIDGNRTEEAIKDALDKVCSYFPSEQEECRRLVGKYSHRIVQVVKLALEPEVACSLMGFCMGLPKEPQCDLCKVMMGWIYSQLKDNRTEQEIKSALDKVCSIVPHRDQQKCLNIVNQYTDEIIRLILSGTDPVEACQLLGICKQNRPLIPFTKIEKTAIRVRKLRGPACDICRKVFGFLHNEVSDPNVKEAVQDALNKVCDKGCSPSERERCKNFVTQYTNEIFNIISRDTDPDNACRQLRVCVYNKSFNRILVEPTNKLGNNQTCYVCEMTAHYIQEELYNSQNQKRINNYLKHELCDRLKHLIERAVCREYVRKYAPVIEELVAQRVFDPKVLCQNELQLCPKTDLKPANQSSIAKKIRTCEICKESVNALDHFLLHGPVESNLSNLANKVCRESSDVKKCSRMIEDCGLQLITWIGRVTNANEVCDTVSLCPAPGKVHVAENRCLVNFN